MTDFQAIEMTPVESSNIKAIGFAAGILLIEFTTGTYAYDGVPPYVHKRLMEAQSKGKCFATTIKDLYPATKVSRAQTEPVNELAAIS